MHSCAIKTRIGHSEPSSVTDLEQVRLRNIVAHMRHALIPVLAYINEQHPDRAAMPDKLAAGIKDVAAAYAEIDDFIGEFPPEWDWQQAVKN